MSLYDAREQLLLFIGVKSSAGEGNRAELNTRFRKIEQMSDQSAAHGGALSPAGVFQMSCDRSCVWFEVSVRLEMLTSSMSYSILAK